MAIREVKRKAPAKKRVGWGITLIAIIALAIIAIIMQKTRTLDDSLDSRKEILASYQTQIEEEKLRTTEIENEIRYRETDEYIKDEAREIFGLHDPNEVIFKGVESEDEQ